MTEIKLKQLDMAQSNNRIMKKFKKLIHIKGKGIITFIVILTTIYILNSCELIRRLSTSPYESDINMIYDNWPFSCEELADYLERYGITDADGNGHPGFAGWTLVKFNYSQFGYDRSFSSQPAGYHCPCNGITYSTWEDCHNNCQVTLGCFTGICAPVGQTCITTGGVDVTFSADISTSVPEWNPEGEMSLRCLVEYYRWQKDVIKHEEHHVQDIEQLVLEANQRWAAPMYFEGCGNSELDADNDLKNSIQRALEDEIQFLQDESDRLSREFHSSPEGGPIRSIDCSKCSN